MIVPDVKYDIDMNSLGVQNKDLQYSSSDTYTNLTGYKNKFSKTNINNEDTFDKEDTIDSLPTSEIDDNKEKKNEHENIIEKYNLESLVNSTISGIICNKKHTYTLVDLIGNGSFAAVFIGRREDDKCFAVKCIPKEDLSEDQLSNQLLEAEILIDLGSHPNVIGLHHIIDDQKFLFLVLDLCDIDLYDILTQDYCGIDKNSYGGLDEKDVRYIFNKISNAVLFCHDHSVYHRDLKPENILIRFNNSPNKYDVKLTDFGLCTRHDFSEAFGCGSLRYIPPECINDSVAVEFIENNALTFAEWENEDPFDNDNKYKAKDIGYSAKANDAWAMGIILINLLFGRNPWYSASMDDECFLTYINDDSDFLKKKFGFTDKFNEYIKKVFAFRPCDRYTLREMVDKFNEIEEYFDPVYNSLIRDKENGNEIDEDNLETEELVEKDLLNPVSVMNEYINHISSTSMDWTLSNDNDSCSYGTSSDSFMSYHGLPQYKKSISIRHQNNDEVISTPLSPFSNGVSKMDQTNHLLEKNDFEEKEEIDPMAVMTTPPSSTDSCINTTTTILSNNGRMNTPMAKTLVKDKYMYTNAEGSGWENYVCGEIKKDDNVVLSTNSNPTNSWTNEEEKVLSTSATTPTPWENKKNDLTSSYANTWNNNKDNRVTSNYADTWTKDHTNPIFTNNFNWHTDKKLNKYGKEGMKFGIIGRKDTHLISTVSPHFKNSTLNNKTNYNTNPTMNFKNSMTFTNNTIYGNGNNNNNNNNTQKFVPYRSPPGLALKHQKIKDSPFNNNNNVFQKQINETKYGRENLPYNSVKIHNNNNLHYTSNSYWNNNNNNNYIHNNQNKNYYLHSNDYNHEKNYYTTTNTINHNNYDKKQYYSSTTTTNEYTHGYIYNQGQSVGINNNFNMNRQYPRPNPHQSPPQQQNYNLTTYPYVNKNEMEGYYYNNYGNMYYNYGSTYPMDIGVNQPRTFSPISVINPNRNNYNNTANFSPLYQNFNDTSKNYYSFQNTKNNYYNENNYNNKYSAQVINTTHSAYTNQGYNLLNLINSPNKKYNNNNNTINSHFISELSNPHKNYENNYFQKNDLKNQTPKNCNGHYYSNYPQTTIQNKNENTTTTTTTYYSEVKMSNENYNNKNINSDQINKNVNMNMNMNTNLNSIMNINVNPCTKTTTLNLNSTPNQKNTSCISMNRPMNNNDNRLNENNLNEQSILLNENKSNAKLDYSSLFSNKEDLETTVCKLKDESNLSSKKEQKEKSTSHSSIIKLRRSSSWGQIFSEVTYNESQYKVNDEMKSFSVASYISSSKEKSLNGEDEEEEEEEEEENQNQNRDLMKISMDATDIPIGGKTENETMNNNNMNNYSVTEKNNVQEEFEKWKNLKIQKELEKQKKAQELKEKERFDEEHENQKRFEIQRTEFKEGTKKPEEQEKEENKSSVIVQNELSDQSIKKEDINQSKNLDFLYNHIPVGLIGNELFNEIKKNYSNQDNNQILTNKLKNIIRRNLIKNKRINKNSRLTMRNINTILIKSFTNFDECFLSNEASYKINTQSYNRKNNNIIQLLNEIINNKYIDQEIRSNKKLNKIMNWKNKKIIKKVSNHSQCLNHQHYHTNHGNIVKNKIVKINLQTNSNRINNHNHRNKYNKTNIININNNINNINKNINNYNNNSNRNTTNTNTNKNNNTSSSLIIQDILKILKIKKKNSYGYNQNYNNNTSTNNINFIVKKTFQAKTIKTLVDYLKKLNNKCNDKPSTNQSVKLILDKNNKHVTLTTTFLTSTFKSKLCICIATTSNYLHHLIKNPIKIHIKITSLTNYIKIFIIFFVIHFVLMLNLSSAYYMYIMKKSIQTFISPDIYYKINMLSNSNSNNDNAENNHNLNHFSYLECIPTSYIEEAEENEQIFRKFNYNFDIESTVNKNTKDEQSLVLYKQSPESIKNPKNINPLLLKVKTDSVKGEVKVEENEEENEKNLNNNFKLKNHELETKYILLRPELLLNNSYHSWIITHILKFKNMGSHSLTIQNENSKEIRVKLIQFKSNVTNNTRYKLIQLKPLKNTTTTSNNKSKRITPKDTITDFQHSHHHPHSHLNSHHKSSIGVINHSMEIKNKKISKKSEILTFKEIKNTNNKLPVTFNNEKIEKSKEKSFIHHHHQKKKNNEEEKKKKKNVALTNEKQINSINDKVKLSKMENQEKRSNNFDLNVNQNLYQEKSQKSNSLNSFVPGTLNCQIKTIEIKNLISIIEMNEKKNENNEENSNFYSFDESKNKNNNEMCGIDEGKEWINHSLFWDKFYQTIINNIFVKVHHSLSQNNLLQKFNLSMSSPTATATTPMTTTSFDNEVKEEKVNEEEVNLNIKTNYSLKDFKKENPALDESNNAFSTFTSTKESMEKAASTFENFPMSSSLYCRSSVLPSLSFEKSVYDPVEPKEDYRMTKTYFSASTSFSSSSSSSSTALTSFKDSCFLLSVPDSSNNAKKLL